VAKIGVLRCHACGAGLLDGARSCTRCGASLDGEAPPTASRTSGVSSPFVAIESHSSFGLHGAASMSGGTAPTKISAKRMRSVEGGIFLPLVVVGLLLGGSLAAALTLGSSAKGGQDADAGISTTQVTHPHLIGGSWAMNGVSTVNSGSMSVVIRVGKPAHFTSFTARNGVSLSGCRTFIQSTSSRSIAVFPVKVTLQNSSTSIEDGPYIELAGAGPNANSSSTLAYGTDTESGPTCSQRSGETFSCGYTSTQAPLSGGSCTGDILLTNYYKSDGSVNFTVPTSASIVVSSTQNGSADSFSIENVNPKSGTTPIFDNQSSSWLLPLGGA